MKANLAQREPEILSRWNRIGLRHRQLERRAPKGTFVLHDGPPYANGHIHLGHALNKVLKDIVLRDRFMAGWRTPYVPGWDCHGLPIEQKVGQELGPKKNQMSALEFRRLCDAYARKWVAIQSEEFQRLGIGGEWAEPYLTCDPQVEVGILKALAEMVRQGRVVKGLKPVFWDTVFQTALADAEVEYQNHTSHSIYVKFPFESDQTLPASLSSLVNPAIVIWTTTPWTLPANVAVSLHPDFEYVALRVRRKSESPEEDLIVAAKLVDSFVQACQFAQALVLHPVLSRELELLRLRHPVQTHRPSLVILGDHVTLEQGTGAVHTAPGHGVEDFQVCARYIREGRGAGLETIVPVDPAGRFTDQFQLMAGMTIGEANEPIIRLLDEYDLLLHHSLYEHSYPHGWRSHKPVIFRATEQWFLTMDEGETPVRPRAVDAIENQVQWIPEWGRSRISNMVRNRPDWCLSRQRTWGVPIPAVISKSTGKSILDAAIIEKLIQFTAEEGSDAWWTRPVEDFLPENFSHPDAPDGAVEKETNILDVWFDSGATHIAVLEDRPELHAPAELYLEGADQHRGWFHTSLLVAMATGRPAPYKAVLTHGFTLDEKGQAMSKSLGNVIPPQDVMDKSGADVLRLWVASEDYRADLTVSERILSQISENYRRYRNTIRFLLGQLEGFDPSTQAVEYSQLPTIDRWLLHELHGLINACNAAYERYEFHTVARLVNQFCTNQLSATYLDIVKDRMYCEGPDSTERRAGQTVQHAAAEALLKIMAPVLVFTTDEAWLVLHPEDQDYGSVHLQSRAEAPAQWHQPELAADFEILLSTRADTLKALEEARQIRKAIGSSLDAAVELLPRDEQTAQVLQRHASLLPELLITSEAYLTSNPNSDPSPEPNPKNAQAPVASLDGSQLRVVVRKATGSKCARCWRRLESVGTVVSHPQVCTRCANVLQRWYHG
jgi:isoleucyl-tRNA synthetase